ncbi:MAG: chemotaxis protein CheX [Syntrophorhabdaceae bacterium]|nr:chemotaxis protein CheX [Syntrophorhabdaceae bacterium]
MDVKYINPFIVATQTVFRTMLGINVEIMKPVLKNVNTTSGDVTGIMGLVGDQKGTIAISLRKKGAIFVFKTLIGDECEDVTHEVVDAIGELTNIISGQARKEFEKAGINLKASIPIVVVGKDVEMNFITKIPIVCLPFQFNLVNGNGAEKELFFLDFSFE